MANLPTGATDAELFAFVDRWAELLEREDYAAAHAFTHHVPGLEQSADAIRQSITGYGRPKADRRVTVAGVPGEVEQVKAIYRDEASWTEIVYGLNLDGVATDLCARFRAVPGDGGLIVQLEDIFVV